MKIFRFQGSSAAYVLALLLSPLMGNWSTAQTAPTTTPQVFAPGIISTGKEFTVTFTPDGKEVYFTRHDAAKKLNHIYVSQLLEGTWQQPTPVAFSSDSWSDLDPCLSPDGKRLFFISTQPKPEAGVDANKKDMDIWVADRNATGWGAPQWISGINSIGKEGSPTVARDSTLYFFSDRDAEPDHNSIYVAKVVNGSYVYPEKLPASVNSGVSDTSPFIAANGKTLLFYSTRPGGYGGADIYVSYYEHGRWTPAINLGAVVNTKDSEYNPSVSPDGKSLYFGRNGQFYEVALKSVKVKSLKAEKFR